MYSETTAQLIVNALQDEFEIGRFSRFCDEPPDFDCATDQEIVDVINRALQKAEEQKGKCPFGKNIQKVCTPSRHADCKQCD